MQSKTPQFDSLLDKVLEDLVPYTRTCNWKDKHNHCQKEYEITTEDIEFLRMLRVPPPNFCPTCRRMRRLMHLNLMRLFSVTCHKEGHDENLISVFPKECPFPIWDSESFLDIPDYYLGKEYDTTKSPYENLFEMRKVFPIANFLNRDSSIVDSPYASGGRNLKNGYYVFGCFNSEDVWYTNHTHKVNEVMNSRVIKNSEYVYQSLFSEHLHKCSHIYFSKQCSESMFLYDCRNCINCFGCVNLRNKSYCIYNVQYTREEYLEFIQKHIPYTRDFIEQSKKKFSDLILQAPVNASRNIQTQNSVGILLENSDDLFDVVDSNNSQHVRYADGVISHKDSMDVFFSGGNSHHLYIATNVGSQSSNVKFSISTKFSTDCEFVFNCKNLTNCFMCFGLQNKSFCILNTQYTEDEYYKKIDNIKTRMLQSGEYGDGVGMEFSAQAYNFSLAQVAFPLSKEEVINLGGYWANEPESNVGDMEIITVDELPQTIIEVDDSIVDKAIMCPVTGRPFKIINSELEFLKKMNLPLPTLHPAERMRRNFVLAPEGRMYTTQCKNCNVEIQSLYDPESGYKLYCTDCFKKEVL